MKTIATTLTLLAALAVSPARAEEKRGEEQPKSLVKPSRERVPESRRDGGDAPNEARAQLEQLARWAKEAEAAGRKEEAQEFRAKMKELMARAGQKDGDNPRDRVPAEGARDGDRRPEQGEARRPSPEAREGRGAPRPEAAGDREREEVRERMAEAEKRLRAAEEAGDKAAVTQLRTQLAEMREAAARRFRGNPEAGRGEGRRPEAGEPGREGEAQRRAHHLGVAIENLRAAGLNEHADAIQREARELLAQAGHGRREPGARERGREQPAGHQPEIGRAMDQMHRQMAEMREMIERLQQQLNQRGPRKD